MRVVFFILKNAAYIINRKRYILMFSCSSTYKTRYCTEKLYVICQV
jgi:hypothetical protein